MTCNLPAETAAAIDRVRQRRPELALSRDEVVRLAVTLLLMALGEDDGEPPLDRYRRLLDSE